jgi:hypothetical protein
VRRTPLPVAVAAALSVCLVAGGASPARAVIGGQPTQVQSAPWTAYVQFADSPDLVLRCTGAIVDASHVVTAAHCLKNEAGVAAQPSQMLVDAGLSNFAGPAATDAPQVMEVSAVRIHPGYAPNTGDPDDPDDVAVLTLATPLDLSGAAVRAIALPAAGAPFPTGAPVTSAGFGRTDPSSSTAGPLNAMAATVDPQGLCGGASDDPDTVAANGAVLCFASPTSTACNGDSGSGVVTAGSNPVLIGIVDASDGNCDVGGAVLAAYVGAPEILRFIQGDDRPPTAPRPATAIPVHVHWSTRRALAGSTVTCTTAGWTVPGRVVYTFLEASTSRVLRSGSPTYKVPKSLVGHRILCRVAVTNDGGTTIATSALTPTIRAAPKAKPRARRKPGHAKHPKRAP